MKKTLLIALLLIPFLGISQTTKPIDGFLGIKFGTGKADVIAAIKAKGGELTRQDDQELVFTNVSLGHRQAVQLSVHFVDGKAYKGFLIFKADEQPQSLDYYNELVKDITGVYGPGKRGDNLKSPYKYGDGNEVTAISMGYGVIFDDWKDGKRILQSKLYGFKEDAYSALLYLDEDLNAQAEAKQKAKEKSDF